MKKIFLPFVLFLISAISSNAIEYGDLKPDGTFMFARRDTCDLYLDFFRPAQGSETEIDGVRKPTVIFAFGGGFKQGERCSNGYSKWFKQLTDAGYSVVTIDYRLGLKGVGNAGINAAFIKNLTNAINVAVEDLFSATNFLIENADSLGIDPANLVISGSSAGAITVLQAEWDICNGHQLASVLPEGFNYAGVMSFSGAIMSHEGAIRYTKCEPCPMLICHGTSDTIVPYKPIAFFNLRFAGSSDICKTLQKNGYNYRFYRFNGNMHEIAGTMSHNLDLETDFMERNIMKGEKIIVDALVTDPTIEIPDLARRDYKSLYN